MKEQQLFNALKESFMPDLKKSDDPMARYDCYSIIHNIDIELKCRRKHYDDLLIEKKKYDALLLRALNFGTDPVYINSTPSGVWVFRIAVATEPEWEVKYLRKTTTFTNANQIPKEIAMLPVIDAEIL